MSDTPFDFLDLEGKELAPPHVRDMYNRLWPLVKEMFDHPERTDTVVRSIWEQTDLDTAAVDFTAFIGFLLHTQGVPKNTVEMVMEAIRNSYSKGKEANLLEAAGPSFLRNRERMN